MLYNLGVGVSEKDLAFVYEGVPGGLKVLPSFCVVPAMRAFPHLGDDMEWSLMLYGEQAIELSRPIPPACKIIQVGECTNIFDKGKGAVYHAKITGKTEDVEHLNDAQWAIFRRNWARLIQKIYQINPLIWPKCSGKMKILSFIEDPEVIKKILKHLGLWDIKARPQPKTIVAAKSPEYHIDYSTSQVPVSDNYLYVDPVYSDGHPA